MEIYVGSTTGVKHKVYWRGEEQDSDNLPTVLVYDITNDPVNPVSPTTIQATLTAEKVETDVGVYQVFLPQNVVSRTRTLKLRWAYNVMGIAQTKEHSLYIVKSYTDLEQTREELKFGGDRSDPNYKSHSELVLAERYARKVIENYTGQNFYPYDETHLVYGSDSDTLIFNSKLIQLHRIYANDYLLIDALSTPKINNWGRALNVTENGFGLRIDRTSALDNTVYTANGMIPPSIHDSVDFFKQGDRYQVYARFGYEEVPDEVELACIELMKDYFSKDLTWKNKYIKKISTFDWDFEYSGEATSGTGNLYADQLLSNYVISQVMLL